MSVTTDELDFKLILDDLDFNAKVQLDIQAAKDLNAQLSQLLQVKRKVSQVSKDDVQNHRRQLQMQKDATVYAEMETRARIQTQMQVERYNQLLARSNEHHAVNNRFLREALALAGSYVSIWGARKLIQNIVQTTAEFELQRTTLAAMLQDAQKAEQIFEQIKAFSVESPFAFKELATYAKQLSAFSVPVDQLFNTTKMLADVSAGLGVGMDRLVLAYGQVRSAAFLRGQEVRQFTEAGIPLLEELRKQFVELGEEGITVGDVFDKISKRLVPFEMVDKVFKDMTSEGGKFYRMQEIQADTLKGKIANLTDAFDIMFATIGERHEDILKGGVDIIRNLALNYEKVGRAIVSLIATYGAYKATLVAVNVLEHAAIQAKLGHITTSQALGVTIKMLVKESAAYAAIQKLISSFNPWVAIGAAVGAVSAYMISASVQANRFRRELEDIPTVKFEEAGKAADNFKRLAEQLKNSTEGSQNYRDAISRLNREYGDYLPNLLNEKNALQEILKVENQVVNAIYARAKAYAYESGAKKIEDRLGESVRKTGDILASSLEGYRVGSDFIGKQAAADFVKGFREAVQNNSGKPFEIFQEEAQKYFGREFVNFNKSVVNSYADAVREMQQVTDVFGRSVEIQFGLQDYSSLIDKKIVEPIEDGYNRAKVALDRMSLSAEEYQSRLRALDLSKLYQMKMAYEEMDQEAKAVGKEGSWANRINEIQQQIDALKPKDLSWLQKLVNPLVTGDGNRDLKVQDMADYNEYLDDLRKAYRQTSQEYLDASNTYKKLNSDKQAGIGVDDSVIAKTRELNDLYEGRKKIIEDIASALGISLEDKKPSSTRKTSSSAKSPAQIELETRIDLLKKLQSAYEKLSDFMDEDKIPAVIQNLFSASGVTEDMVKNLDFRKQLVSAANELAKFDTDAADRLRNYLGYDETSDEIDRLKKIAQAQREAQEAQERYKDFIDGWLVGGELGGEGAQYRISKILSDYEKALDQIDKKTSEARQKLYDKAKKEKKVGIWSALGFATDYNDITERGDLAKSNALAQYSEEARKAIEDLYKEWRDGAMDFNNLSDKSIGQLKKMRDAINKLELNDVVPEGVQKKLGSFGITLEQLEDILKGLKDEDLLNKLLPEIKEETARQLKYIAGELLNCATAVREFAEAAGNTEIASLIRSIEGVAEVTKAAAEGFRQGGVLGAVVGTLSSMVTGIFNAATEMRNLKNTITDTAEAARRANFEKSLAAGVDTIWGEDSVKKIRNAVESLKELQKVTDATRYVHWEGGWGGLGAGRNTIENLAKKLGYDLYDMYGNLNSEGLQAILDTYDKLSEKDRQWIQEVINSTEMYAEAMETIRTAIQDTWSGLADDMADKLITARTEVGDAYAALSEDMRSIFGDMADDIARKLISSFIIDNVLSKYSDDLQAIYMMMGGGGANDEIASAFASLANSVIADAGIAADFTNKLYDSFEMAGIDMAKASESSDTLANGIKGITEGTANLLASYLNAVRADVARGCIQRDGILQYVERIASYVASPTIMDHLNRIQANTYDTALATQGILANLQSVMTSENGPTAIRVLQ